MDPKVIFSYGEQFLKSLEGMKLTHFSLNIPLTECANICMLTLCNLYFIYFSTRKSSILFMDSNYLGQEKYMT